MRIRIQTFSFCLLAVLSFAGSSAQISPPGLGAANTAGWFALGVRQELDTVNEKQVVTYVGLGRKSNPDNYDPYHKPSIFVLNQEFYFQHGNHRQYSFAVSYRKQQEYSNDPPYDDDDPGFRHEFRLYGRYSYILKGSKFKLVVTARQEVRKFYTPYFTFPEENFQLRSRLRSQLTMNLNAKKTHRLIASSEFLFSIDKESVPSDKWSDFDYREHRLCAYYSFSPEKSPIIINLGYMNNLAGMTSAQAVHYIAVDLIWENPFRPGLRTKEKIDEYLE